MKYYSLKRIRMQSEPAYFSIRWSVAETGIFAYSELFNRYLTETGKLVSLKEGQPDSTKLF